MIDIWDGQNGCFNEIIAHLHNSIIFVGNPAGNSAVLVTICQKAPISTELHGVGGIKGKECWWLDYR
ncbi:MAG TPA: hypothetical protein DHD79_11350 [Firmicutes bacterium]|nr:hypothetical protein [Bacillota bacterium]HBL69478.1 hypothetical protein [Bacillota bacterium]HCF89979.1 hypothetical protein [Bacillota bacterium]HCF91011.1 hypothetical protein [Bacillota bacterium]HCX71818.1 hypothetical protein [Bacillota bacterium]